MTRILVQRGSSGSSSSNPSRSPSLHGPSSARAEPQVTVPPIPSGVKDEDSGGEVLEPVVGNEVLECSGSSDSKAKNGDLLVEGLHYEQNDASSDKIADVEKAVTEEVGGTGELMKGLCGLRISERLASENEGSSGDSSVTANGTSHPPPPPPLPPTKPSAANLNSRRNVSSNLSSVHIGSSRRASAWPVVSARTSPAGSRPSSPRSHNENEGYNSADEQNPCFVSSYDDLEKERQFEVDIRRAKGFEVKRMMEDGNCLFRAVADQVYGDSELYDLVRQMSIDYMEGERDHFSQFITEGFTSYCKRKRRDKVYGNNVEIQALCEMYNRPIHIYSYTTEPINIFHGSYNTDTPPIRLSYHHGNHYNSLVNPRRLTIGAGLGFGCLRGTNVDKDQIKAAIKAQQDQQIDNALLAQGRFYSDIELTEKEIERMVMEVSRAEYLADGTFKQQLACRESSTSNAEPSSSGARTSVADRKMEFGKEQDCNPSRSMQMVLSMGFSYLQVIEAYSIFGDDVDSMVCYLLETGSSSRRKGFLPRQAEWDQLKLVHLLHRSLSTFQIGPKFLGFALQRLPTMSQNGKLMPNLDQQSTKLLNLTVLQRIDPFVEEILITAAHVTFYEFNIDLSQWSRKDVEGSLFVVKRNTQPRFQFIVMNRRNTENLVENLLGDFEYEVQVPYLLYRNAAQEVNGIWFYNARECEEVANLFSRILNAYSKVPQKSKVSSTKSEFEELEAVPTMAVMDGPLEPSSSTAVADVTDDLSFVNFFGAAMNIGNTANAPITGQPYQSSTIPLPSVPTNAGTPTVPTLPLPVLSTTTPLMPPHDTPESNSSSNRATNLVKPSSFFVPPPSSAMMIPPVSSSTPTAPPLHPAVSIQRPYGAPLLQPFPPPTPPPPSLTPASVPPPNYGPVITREKVRDALLVLVQDNQFIDMVYRALLNAHQS